MTTINNNYKEYTVKVYKDRTEWFLNGKLHRKNDPAVEYADGYKAWWVNGKRHREDGPAIEWADGSKEWWLNRKLHRENGPAIERANGTKEWYLNDIKYSEEQWKKEIAKIKNKNSCNGKIVEIDGKKYRLIEEK